MQSYRDHLIDRIEGMATENGVTMLQAAEYANSGWWIFKDTKSQTRARLYYSFQDGYCTCNTGKGNVYPGVLCNYGIDADENKLISWIKEKIKES